jgi:Asp-tRNA(Asn)/Glu-tRNA(Gln) amidotransferase A subunit family amidase
MQPKTRLIPLLLSLAFLLAVTFPLAASAKLYRWVDEQGNVHYTDKIPPEQAKQERSEFNKQGVEVERVEAAKTPEELAKEQELERLREEQQKLIEQQKEADQALLRTYRSEDDLIMARDGKLTAIDVQIRLARNNIEAEKSHLADLQQLAADQERKGEQVSQDTLNRIDKLRNGLKENYDLILRKKQEQEAILKEFQNKLERYRALKHPNSESTAPAQGETPTIPLLDTMVLCNEQPACDTFWKRAQEYLRKNAVTPVQIASDNIVTTAAPKTDEQFSITVSRTNRPNENFTRIFLDLQCKDTTLGNAFCKSEQVQKIRDGFRPALGVKRVQPTGASSEQKASGKDHGP